MKKCILGLFSSLLLFTLTGCGDKTALSAEDFKMNLEKKGYTVSDATDQAADYDSVAQVYLAISPNSTYQIEYKDYG